MGNSHSELHVDSILKQVPELYEPTEEKKLLLKNLEKKLTKLVTEKSPKTCTAKSGIYSFTAIIMFGRVMKRLHYEKTSESPNKLIIYQKI